jgi:hypothetical protein
MEVAVALTSEESQEMSVVSMQDYHNQIIAVPINYSRTWIKS